ncbi:hypothetical protein V5799_002684 [Amblyomma americanum]|uniref:Uncharacterized protein n=1 Tax=Amblyomma americanum TaxID=6943 RepID=A0AAQ4DB44_AMBAM
MTQPQEWQEGIYTLFSFGSDMVQRRWTCWPWSPPRIQHKDECMRLRVEVMPMIPCRRLVCAGCYAAHCGRKDHSSALYLEVFRENDVAVVACTNEELASGHFQCWNVGCCDTVGLPFMVLERLEEDFQYHNSSYSGAVKWSFLGGSVVCPSGVGAQPRRFAGASAEQRTRPAWE